MMKHKIVYLEILKDFYFLDVVNLKDDLKLLFY